MSKERIATPIACEVGRVYLVPCVRVTGADRAGWGLLPVIGPEHSDAEIIKFPDSHWHIDWRFATAKQFNESTYKGDAYCYSTVQQRFPSKGWVNKEPLIDERFGVQMRRMKCKRTLPEYPHQAAPWMAALEDEYAACKLKPGLICPHKGLPLIPVAGSDYAVCAGHGLRWNVKTGSLADRTMTPSPIRTPEKGGDGGG